MNNNLNNLFEEFYNQNKDLNLLIEIGKEVAPILKDIEKLFDIIRKKIIKKEKLKDDIKSLESKISEFTKIEHVNIRIKKNIYNAGIIPVYKMDIGEKVNLKDIFLKEEVRDTIIDSTKYIKKIIIIFGDDIIKSLTSSELVAVLLHEVGHLFQHTSSLPTIISRLVKFISGLSLAKSIIMLPFFSGMVIAPISIALFLTSRTLTFIEHKSEFNADNYASKYGYGDEMIKVNNKFRNFTNEHENKKSVFRKIYDFIIGLILPSTHPSDSKRMCLQLENIKKNYKENYPEFDEELNIALADVKCDSTFNKVKYSLGFN